MEGWREMCIWIYMEWVLPCIVYCGNGGKGSFYYSTFKFSICSNIPKNKKERKLLSGLMTSTSNGKKENSIINMT